jgi:hypothetical protein
MIYGGRLILSSIFNCKTIPSQRQYGIWKTRALNQADVLEKTTKIVKSIQACEARSNEAQIMVGRADPLQLKNTEWLKI